MSTRGGKAVRVVMGKEDTPGAGAATPKGFVVPFASVQFSDSQGFAESDEIVAGSNPGQPFEDVKASNGTLVAAVTCALWGLLAKWLTGNLVTTGSADPYTHTSKAQDADPSTLWLERGHLDAGKYDLFKFVRMTSLKLSATKKAGLLKATIGLVGSGNGTRNGVAPYDAAPVTFTGPRLNAKDVVVKVDTIASTLVKQIDVTLERSGDPQTALDGTDEAADVAVGGWTVKADITAAWDSADTIRQLATDKAEHVFEFSAPEAGSASHLVGFKLPEARVFDTGGGDVSNRGPLEVKVSVVGFLADNADGSAFVLTAVNDKAAAFYTTA